MDRTLISSGGPHQQYGPTASMFLAVADPGHDPGVPPYGSESGTCPVCSDQRESRTPMPVRARRSERRVSTSFTIWSGRMGREGFEPLVVHLACLLTTALQAAARNTTRGNRSVVSGDTAHRVSAAGH